ncbi:kelch domain-containing protein 10-like isoform X1 [Vanacampus margaritifer]
MSTPVQDRSCSHLNKFVKLSWRPSSRDSGLKMRARWLQARRLLSPAFPNLRIPNRFLREGPWVPSARSGHRCVADSTHLYVFGGYNPDFEEAGGAENEAFPLFRELWSFHFATTTWQRVQTEGYIPTELASMSTVFHGNNLLVFGGTGIPFGENNGNDVHVCNVKYKQWNLLGCKGTRPNKIYGQAMVIINGCLYVFGGTTGYFYSTDLHRLDLATKEWSHIKPNNAPLDLPEERYRHELAHDGHRIYVLGGGTSWSSYRLDKIHAYNLETNYWEEIVTKPHGKLGYPAARRCHSCVQVRQGEFSSMATLAQMSCRRLHSSSSLLLLLFPHYLVVLPYRGVHMRRLRWSNDHGRPVEAPPWHLSVDQVACHHAGAFLLPLCRRHACGLHVCPRRCGEHVGQSSHSFVVQSVAGGAWPA